DLSGEVAGHRIDVVGEVFPCATDTEHLRLPTQLPFRADLARHTRHLGRKGVELVDHRVDRVLELEDLPFHVDSYLARQVAASDPRRDLGDVPHLRREVAAHRVHGVREILPRTGDAWHDGLTAELPVGADFASDPRDFRCKGAQLVDHRVDGLFQLEDL